MGHYFYISGLFGYNNSADIFHGLADSSIVKRSCCYHATHRTVKTFNYLAYFPTGLTKRGFLFAYSFRLSPCWSRLKKAINQAWLKTSHIPSNEKQPAVMAYYWSTSSGLSTSCSAISGSSFSYFEQLTLVSNVSHFFLQIGPAFIFHNVSGENSMRPSCGT